MSINMLDIRMNYVKISNKIRRELKEDFDSHRCVWCVNEYIFLQTFHLYYVFISVTFNSDYE